MDVRRQGDITFKNVASVPKGSKSIYKGQEYIVALGEATGHHHKLAVREGEIEVFEANGIRYLEVRKLPAELTHQEHKPFILEPGVWEVGNEREFDYFMNEARKVQD